MDNQEIELDFSQMLKEMESTLTLAWDKHATGKAIKKIREENENFKKFFCKHSLVVKKAHPFYDYKHKNEECENSTHKYDCKNCKNFYKDITLRTVTRLADPEGAPYRWADDVEKGIRLTFDKVLYFALWAQIPLHKIIVLNNGYEFDDEGIIIKKYEE